MVNFAAWKSIHQLIFENIFFLFFHSLNFKWKLSCAHQQSYRLLGRCLHKHIEISFDFQLTVSSIMFMALDIVHHNFSHRPINYVFSIKIQDIVWLTNMFITRRLVDGYHLSILHIEKKNSGENGLIFFVVKTLMSKTKLLSNKSSFTLL